MQETVKPPVAEDATTAAPRMFGLDRFALGLVVVVILLVGGLFVLVLRQPAPVPMDESTPSGVVHNYYLAIQQQDLAKAYAYFSEETRSRLSYEQFADRVSRPTGNRGVSIDDERLEGDTARVNVSVTSYYGAGPFSSGQYRSSHSIVLRQEAGAWRIALPLPANSTSPPYLPGELFGV
ncbi:MAG TPA: hypothetical protein VF937_08645 [Chloroflexota bacterium]